MEEFLQQRMVPAAEAASALQLLQPSPSSPPPGSKRKSALSFESETEPMCAEHSSSSSGCGCATVSSKRIGAAPPKRRIRRKRKSTYVVRKEESTLLLKQVEALERQVAMFKGRTEQEPTEKELLNAILHETRRNQQLSLAVAQSAVSGYLNADQSNPLSSFIHLGKDWVERRKTLVGVKDKMVRNAYEYTRARSRFLDPLRSHHSEERFENANGDYCTARFDLIQFEGAESVKQVYDALIFYLLNMEISVSEHLGHITVREDVDTIEEDVMNFRLLSTQFGVNVEANVVTFTKFVENQYELSSGGGGGGGAAAGLSSPCGIVTYDCVDEDELYAYTSRDKVRGDVSAAMVLTPHMKKKKKKKTTDNRECEKGEELVVVMALAKFHRLHSAEFAIPAEKLQDVREHLCWGAAMVKAINELLHSTFVLPAT